MSVRYAICGLSNRGLASFILPLIGTQAGEDTTLGYGRNEEDFSEYGQLVAIIDPDEARVRDFISRYLGPQYPKVEVLDPSQFEQYVNSGQVDRVIVASPDDSHEFYITKALEANVAVITEKPMTSSAAAAQRVLDAEAHSQANVTVTHNFRYTARHRMIKDLIENGAIGRVVHVDFSYHVDIRHGASYFLRWNRQRERSGGLSIHKSTHHIDLVNWWLKDQPKSVYAQGGRSFYGPQSPHHPDPGNWSKLSKEQRRAIDPYYQAQHGSGTFPTNTDTSRTGLYDLAYDHEYPADRDFTVYDQEIDIEDHLAALITFEGGATCNYSVNFSAPWEGYRLVITGTHGQVETQTGRLPGGDALPGTDKIILRPLFEQPQELAIDYVVGGHEGADPLLRHDLFIEPTQYSRDRGLVASSWEGAVAVAAGEAMWRSAQDNKVWLVTDLLTSPGVLKK